MTIYSQIQIEQDLNRLTKLVKSGLASESLVRNIHKLMGIEISQLEIDLAATEKDLNGFETRHNLSTAEFFQQWKAGKTDDRMDYVEWASLAQMAENLRTRLEFLKGENQK